MEVAGPGYINIFLNRNWIATNIANIALKVSSFVTMIEEFDRSEIEISFIQQFSGY